MVTLQSVDGKDIASINDWFSFSPPAKGEIQWKDGRSAKELAKAWFRTGKAQIPVELSTLLQSHPITRDFHMEVGLPEKETILDDFKGSGRNHDLVLIGNTLDNRVLIAVEAKTDESFGDVIGDYIQSSIRANPRSRVPDRIHQLSLGLFGHMEVTNLRYQLLHAAAGTLIEATNQNASHAVLVIHEFIPTTGKTDKAKQNELDLAAFVERLSGGRQTLTIGELIGPFHVPGGGKIPCSIPLYIGKIESKLCQNHLKG
jgi:hypothetical protein